MRSMVTEAKYTKRYNTGEFEFEELTLGAVVDEKDSGADVLKELKKQIHEAFTGEAAAEEPKPSAKKADKKEEKKNGKAKPDSSNDEDADDESSEEETSGDDGESDQDDETTDSEDGNDSDDSSDESESDDSEDGEEDDGEEDSKSSKSGSSKSGKSSTEKAGKKKFVKKPQAYDRGIEQHKEIFSKLVGSVAPDWKKSDASKALAKKTSEALEGTPFLDENGEVVAEFKAEVKKRMAAKKK